MRNLLVDIATSNLPNNFIDFIRRALYEKISRQFKASNIAYNSIDVDSIRNHFVIYIKGSEDFSKDLDFFENIIRDTVQSIKFKYAYNSDILEFKESISYIKLISNEKERIFNITENNDTVDDKILDFSMIDDYNSELLKNEIILKKEKRLELFEKESKKIARSNGCIIINNQSIVNEYINKFDYPVCVEEKFDSEFLSIDKYILYTVLMDDFAVLPLEFENGNSSNIFIYAKNKISEDSKDISDRINSKLEEIKELINKKEDTKLEDYTEKLKEVAYINNYGSYYDKTKRLIEISSVLCKMLSVSDETIKSVNRISKLCKADIATNIVKKFFYLHGLIGRLYARADGEEKIVCEGIYEHIKPRYISDDIPNSIAAKIVSISDKMEYVTAFVISSNDKNLKYNYKIRNTIVSIITTILQAKLDFNMDDFIDHILYVFLQEKGIVDYENIHSNIKDIILDVYRDECVKSGITFYEFDMINFDKFNILNIKRILDSFHKVNTENDNKLIEKLEALSKIESEKISYTPISLDYNDLEEDFENILNLNDDELYACSSLIKGVFHV